MFDHKSQNCAFAEAFVSFLYDELDGESRASFEAHAQSCSSCADELASFGAVRASILDWRALEFEPLETPPIKFRFERKNQSPSSATISPVNQSWLDGLRKIFAPYPAFASVAALLLVTICGALILYNFGGARQIAEIKSYENSASTSISTTSENLKRVPSFENNIEKDVKESIAENPSETKFSNKENDAPQNSRENIGEPRNVKISDGARVSKKETLSPKTYDLPNRRRAFDTNLTATARSISPVKRRQIPKLSNIEDDEEEQATLHLTDLLDEASGK